MLGLNEPTKFGKLEAHQGIYFRSLVVTQYLMLLPVAMILKTSRSIDAIRGLGVRTLYFDPKGGGGKLF